MTFERTVLATFLWLLVIILQAPSASSEQGETSDGTSKIIITAPKEGEVLPSGTDIQVDYQFIPGSKDNGNHVHVFLDGENEGTTRRSPRVLGKLAPGKHMVLLKISNKEHDWINVETSVHFEVSAQKDR